MLKYKCLVLDHDNTVVQTEKAIGYPYFRDYIRRIRPGSDLTYAQYVEDCNNMIFADMCRLRWNFTEEELQEEYIGWKAYSLTHTPPIYPGMERIIHRQKEEGGLVCVASLSSRDNITRDYAIHFGIQPDAIYDYDLPPDKRKPNPYPLRDIMERFHLEPSDLLMVDDMKQAWFMAKPLGVAIAFAAWGKEEFPLLAEEMRKLCNFSFDSVSQLEHFLFEE